VTAGQSVILDAVFSKQHERERAEALAQDLGVPFCGLWLEVPLAVALARIEARTDDASDATARVRIMQEERLERPVLWTHLMGADACSETLVAQALQRIKTG
jgi:predicted kinase